MSRIDQSTLDLTDDVEKALEAWMRTQKAIRISSAWRAGVEWGRAHPETSEKATTHCKDCGCGLCKHAHHL